jgi:hypothetical protein
MNIQIPYFNEISRPTLGSSRGPGPTLQEGGDLIHGAIRQNPVVALGAAVAAGVLLGWFVKRT